MDLSAFLKQHTLPPHEESLVLSDRFLGPDGQPVASRLSGISEEESAALRQSCRRRSQDGLEPSLDRERYLRKLAAACVRFPDLRDAALQQSWGVLGEEALLGKMLTAGEFARLLEAAQRVCGFSDPEAQKQALKKASAGETAN